jgi:hypothetical protein
MSDLMVAFAGQSVQIACPSEEVSETVRYMFEPHTVDSCGSPDNKLRVKTGKSPDRFNLYRGGNRLARNKKLADLFISLYDAVIRDVITPASDGLALHAGAVSRDGENILIPGASGAGKSTLTSWFLSRGWNYLTDELAYLTNGLATEYLTRPISIKKGSVETVSTLFDQEVDDQLLYRSTLGIYLHHSVLNDADLITAPCEPTMIVFPAWKRDADYRLEPLTVAHTATRLMNVLVNARNLPGHGVPDVIKFASTIPSFRLHYSSFDQLNNLEQDLKSKTRPTLADLQDSTHT